MYDRQILFFLATARIRLINSCSSEIFIVIVSKAVVNIFELSDTDSDHTLGLLGGFEADKGET